MALQFHRFMHFSRARIWVPTGLCALALLGSIATAQVTARNVNEDIDKAFAAILSTKIGQGICADILGANAEALIFHLGLSPQAATSIAQDCRDRVSYVQPNSSWIYPTSSPDIRKLTLREFKPRKYRVIQYQFDFPIESWTDPFTNTTTLLSHTPDLPFERLVQLLAHETAVYFDSKSSPSHPDALNIYPLRTIQLLTEARMDPLVAIANPLTAHTLTYVRALQVEFQIVDELIANGKIRAPADHLNPYINFLLSDRCQARCLQDLVLNMRATFLPLALPLLAFSPYYRSQLNRELPKLKPYWSENQWSRFQSAINQAPVDFLKSQFSDSPLLDLKRVFQEEGTKPSAPFTLATQFLKDDLWPFEWPALTQTQVIVARYPETKIPLLEFMKIPLLSGYNVALSSGPRVRVRTGNIE